MHKEITKLSRNLMMIFEVYLWWTFCCPFEGQNPLAFLACGAGK